MKRPTSQHALFAIIASFALVCLPSAFAQHGGGHGGGGGHAGGGGGFHGSSGISGGSHSGGYGGYHGGAASSGGSHGSYGGMRGESSSSRASVSSRPWASEGQGVRNTSPGWHSFEHGGNSAGVSARSGATGMGERSTSMGASRTAIADGQWHGFGATHSAVGSSVAAGARPAIAAASFNHAGFLGPVRPAFGAGVWRGGWGGWGWRGGWGWGWGGCWGCGWGLGWWGWGPGWGWWNPYWSWSPWYNPYWSYDDPPYAYNP